MALLFCLPVCLQPRMDGLYQYDSCLVVIRIKVKALSHVRICN